MKVLVTGGAGFIGSWVVEEFLKGGHETTVLDNLANGRESNLAEAKKSRFFKGLFVKDIRDEKAVEEAFKEKFDACVHLAASIHVHGSIEDPKEPLETNVNGTFNILEAARKADAKVVFVSTGIVYASTKGGKISEEHPVSASSPYAATKIAAEKLVEAYQNTYDLPTVILRPFNTYGPRELMFYEGKNPVFMGVIPTFINRKLKGLELVVYGDGTQTRDFHYVGDCADFIARATLSEKAVGQIINSGAGQDISINDLAKLILGSERGIKHVPHHHMQSEHSKLVCDYSKAEKLLGWRPRVSLEEGIKLTEAWIVKTFGPKGM
jgi:dTDP-glucose 4,6-dehydratase